MARNPARTPRIPPAATMYLRPDETTRRSTPPATASDRQPGGRSNCPDTVIGGTPSILYGSANWKVFPLPSSVAHIATQFSVGQRTRDLGTGLHLPEIGTLYSAAEYQVSNA